MLQFLCLSADGVAVAAYYTFPFGPFSHSSHPSHRQLYAALSFLTSFNFANISTVFIYLPGVLLLLPGAALRCWRRIACVSLSFGAIVSLCHHSTTPPRLLPLCVLFQFSACRHSSHWCINNGDVWVCGGVAGSVAFCWTSFNCQSVCQALAIISFYFFPVFFFFCGSMLAPKTPWISFPLTAFFRWIFQFLYAPDSFFCLCLPLCAEPFRIVALFAIQNNFYRSSCAVQTIQQDSINLESLHLNACHWQGKEFTKHM